MKKENSASPLTTSVHTKRRIAVIGAGPSGLVAVKELLQEGHEVTCYEKAPDLGGVFRYDPEGGGVWETCRLTSSAFVTAFSDFPLAHDSPTHFTHHEYMAYLKRYVDHFKLEDHLLFEHEVKHTTQNEDGSWQVEVQDATGKKTVTTFDSLAICSGIHQKPSFPEIPNREQFKGTISHSSSYKNANAFKGKRVVVVGAGESGSDILAEVAEKAEESVLSLRRGVFVQLRFVNGYPTDYYTNRIVTGLPDWVIRRDNPSSEVGRLRNIMAWLTLPVHLLFQIYLIARVRLHRLMTNWGWWTPNSTPEVSRLIQKLRGESGGGLAEQFATKSERFVYALANGSAQLKPQIKSFTSDGVAFDDGSEFACDHVLFCTGFKSAFPFMDIDLSDSRNLYRYCFFPQLGDRLCFIGAIRPSIGSIPPISELQSRWFALISSGKLSLAEPEQMQQHINEHREMHKIKYRDLSERLNYLVDYTSYMDEMATIVDCKPRWSELIKEPSLLLKVYCAPFSAFQYRLRGPHAQKELAKRILSYHPIVYAKVEMAFLLFYLLFCKSLSKLGFQKFNPHLKLDE